MGGVLDIQNSVFESNSSLSHGGAVNTHSGSEIISCTFQGNTSGDEGGAIFGISSIGGNVSVRDTICTGNTAAHGGAVGSRFVTVKLENCVLDGNLALSDYSYWSGGAIECWEGSLQVVNTTIVGNSHEGGSCGGIELHDIDELLLSNCIVFGNTGDQLLIDSAKQVSVTYTDIEGGWAGDGNISSDPLFTDSFGHIGPGSPCIDAGDNEAALPDLEFDLDGYPRYHDDPGIPDTGHGTSPLVDMGAYEYQDDSSRLLTLTVNPDPLVPRQPAHITVSEADTLGIVYLIAGTGGPGYYTVPQLHVTLDLGAPLMLFMTVVANDAGTADVEIVIPNRVAGTELWTQALQQGRKSNVVWTRVVE